MGEREAGKVGRGSQMATPISAADTMPSDPTGLRPEHPLTEKTSLN